MNAVGVMVAVRWRWIPDARSYEQKIWVADVAHRESINGLQRYQVKMLSR